MVGSSNFTRIVPDDGPTQYHKWYWSWAYAVAINFVILWVFAATVEMRISYGQPAPAGAIPVIVLSENQLTAAPPVPEVVPAEAVEPEVLPEPEPQVTPPLEQEQRRRPQPQPEVLIAQLPPSAADIVLEPKPDPDPGQVVVEEIEPPALPIFEPEPEEVYADLTGPEIDEAYRQSKALPEIDLPEVGASGSSGVVAIFCPDVFDDPEKAAECAGRPEIRSGWTKTNEDWTDITASLRRGGINLPVAKSNYDGPAWRAPLAENEQYYEPTDKGLIIGRDAARTLADARGYQQLKKASFGTEQTTNLIGQSLGNLGGEVQCFTSACDEWQPSWTLRDDPNINTDTIDRIIREGDSRD